MPLDKLKPNIEREKQITREIMNFYSRLESMNAAVARGTFVDPREIKMILNAIDALAAQLKIINNAIPDLINEISFYKTLVSAEQKVPKEKPALLEVSYQDSAEKKQMAVTIKKDEEKKFLENLTKQEESTRKIRRDSATALGMSTSNFYNAYINTSNRLFRESSNKLVDKGYFDFIKNDLRKITSPFMVHSYVAVSLFSTFLSAIASLFIFVILLLFRVSFPISFLVLIGIPIVVFILFIFSPSLQKKSLERSIEQELPFLTIYMSAIATSGLEPSKIFSVVATSKDYPATQRELKKLTNYINFYGYDIVTALKFIAKNSPSERLSQLFDGLSNTITSGGRLEEYLNKHAETLLFDYRLEREKYTHVAETFMNIYISIVIAAPMIMMMLFILIGLTGSGGGLLGNPTLLSIMTIFIISLLNVGFLLFLNTKQPKF